MLDRIRLKELISRLGNFEDDIDTVISRLLDHPEKVDEEPYKSIIENFLKELDKEAYDKWSALMFDMQYRETSYPFHENNVKEFAEFCKESGGFTIG